MTARVLVVLPALNAETTLAHVLDGVLALLPEVLVVDDGSSDRTAEVARTAGAMVLRHERNRGKGAALQTGFAYALAAGYDAVITLDADGQHLPGEIPKFVAAYDETHADLIIGGRSHLFSQMLPGRRIANRFSARTIAFVSGTGVTDSQSGFRLYSARMLRGIALRSSGFDMESEVIVRAGRGGFLVLTIPIELGFVDGLSTSHYRALSDTLRIAWTVFRTRFLGG